MTDLPIEGELVPIVQGNVVARASNISATGTGGNRVQAQLETLKADVATNTRSIQSGGNNAPDVSSLISKVDALYPLTPDVDILTGWADIYDPEVISQTVNEVPGYSDFIDYRAVDDRFESTGITFASGGGVVNYTNVAGDFHRCFGFRVSGPADQVLLWVIDGAVAIPLIDITAAGNVRVNDYTPARTQDQVVTGAHNLVRAPTTGTGIIAVGGAVSTYTIPAYPGNTSAQSRSLDLDFDVLVNGVNSTAGGAFSFNIPDDLTAQAKDTVTHTFFLGFPSNRSVTATVGIEARVDGGDLVIDLTLESAPSDITLQVNTFDVLQSYTATTTIARVDNFLTITGQGGNFTFTGAEELLFAFHPIPNTTTMRVVPVAAEISSGTVRQLNDPIIPEPDPGFAAIRIPDSIQFRSFLPDHFLNHPDLVDRIRDRDTKWVYALARLQEVTGHAVTAVIDLAAGSTIGGVAIGNQTQVVVHQATGTGTAAGELVSTIVLPANYTDFQYLHVVLRIGGIVPVEWRNGLIDIRTLSGGDFGASDVMRVQGASDFSWTIGSRGLVNQGGQEIYRAVLLNLF